jgi:hypothetical protein
MTRRDILRLAAAGLAASNVPVPARAQRASAGDIRLLARRRAIEARRRLAADGWRARDGVWSGQLNATQRHAIPVHLIAGNTYLFVMALRPVNALQVFSLLDAEGRLVSEKSAVSDPGLSALLVEPASSGRYHIFSEVPTDSPTTEAALVYLYR